MAEPLYGVSEMKLKKASHPDEPLQFQLKISFLGPNRPTVFEAELDENELISLMRLCQMMQERYRLAVPASLLPTAETKPPVATVKKRKPPVKAKKRKTLH